MPDLSFNLSLEALQAIAVYSWIGMIVFGVLGLYEIEKARRANAKPAIVPIALTASFAWRHCPGGHCKVLTNRDWSCPACGAQLA